MLVNNIDLTPAEILKRFQQMEEHLGLQHQDFTFYKSSQPFPDIDVKKDKAIPLDFIQREAKSMCDFVGLTNYRPVVEVKELESAGNVQLNHGTDFVIAIDKSIAGNIVLFEMLRATLAHEICHKLLFERGIYFRDDTRENEIYADLAVFYVGFGELILDGIKKEKLELNGLGLRREVIHTGYLSEETYAYAFVLTCAIHQTDPSERFYRLSDESKELIKKAMYSMMASGINIIPSPTTTQLNSSFTSANKDIASLFRTLTLLEQLIAIEKEKLAGKIADLDKSYYKSELFSKESLAAHPVSFSWLDYSKCNAPDVVKDNKRMQDLEKMLVQTIRQILSAESVRKHEDLRINFITCPVCGYKIKNMKEDAESSHLICRKCNTHFVINTALPSFNEDTADANEEANDIEEEEVKPSFTQRIRNLFS